MSQHPIDPRLVKKEPTNQVEIGSAPKSSLKDPRGPRMASDPVRSDGHENGNSGPNIAGIPSGGVGEQSIGDKANREEGYQVAADPQSRDHNPPSSAYQVARDSDISAPVGEQRTASNLLPQTSSFTQSQQPTRANKQEPTTTPPNLAPPANSAAGGGMPSGHQTSSGSKIFVGGLSWETQEASLRRYFETFGEVLDCVIMRDRHTGHPRGFGFVTFADDAVAERAAARRHDLDGRQVEAKRAVPRNEFPAGSAAAAGASAQQQAGAMGTGAAYARGGSAGAQDPRYATQGGAGYAMSSAAMRQHHTTRGKVFVGGLPSSCGNEDFKAYFQQFGEVVDAQVMIDHNTGNSRGFGFVTFNNESTVETVVGPGRSNTRHEIMGKNVEVKRAEPKGMSNSSRRLDAYGTTTTATGTGMRSGAAGSNSSNLGGAGDAGSNAAAAAAYYNNYATASLAEQYGAYYNNPQWQQYYAAMGYNFNAYPQGYNPYNYLSAYMQNVANGSNTAAGGMPTNDAAAAAAGTAAGGMPGTSDVQTAGTSPFLCGAFYCLNADETWTVLISWQLFLLFLIFVGYDTGRAAASGGGAVAAAAAARYGTERDGSGNPSGGNGSMGTGSGPSGGSSGGARRSSRRDERYHPYR